MKLCVFPSLETTFFLQHFLPVIIPGVALSKTLQFKTFISGQQSTKASQSDTCIPLI